MNVNWKKYNFYSKKASHLLKLVSYVQADSNSIIDGKFLYSNLDS